MLGFDDRVLRVSSATRSSANSQRGDAVLHDQIGLRPEILLELPAGLVVIDDQVAEARQHQHGGTGGHDHRDQLETDRQMAERAGHGVIVPSNGRATRSSCELIASPRRPLAAC